MESIYLFFFIFFSDFCSFSAYCSIIKYIKSIDLDMDRPIWHCTYTDCCIFRRTVVVNKMSPRQLGPSCNIRLYDIITSKSIKDNKYESASIHDVFFFFFFLLFNFYLFIIQVANVSFSSFCLLTEGSDYSLVRVTTYIIQ